jgi:hypothetical protein
MVIWAHRINKNYPLEYQSKEGNSTDIQKRMPK